MGDVSHAGISSVSVADWKSAMLVMASAYGDGTTLRRAARDKRKRRKRARRSQERRALARILWELRRSASA